MIYRYILHIRVGMYALDLQKRAGISVWVLVAYLNPRILAKASKPYSRSP